MIIINKKCISDFYPELQLTIVQIMFKNDKKIIMTRNYNIIKIMIMNDKIFLCKISA